MTPTHRSHDMTDKLLREALEWYASPAAWTMEQLEGAHGDYGARARAALAAAPQPALKDREALMEVIQQALWCCPDTGQMPDDAITDALLARGLRLPGEETMAWAVIGKDGKPIPQTCTTVEYMSRAPGPVVRVAIRVMEGGDDAA